MSAIATNRGRRPHLALVAASPLRAGGTETFCRFLAAAALDDGWFVTIALSGEDIYRDVALPNRSRLVVERVDWVDPTLTGDRRYHPRTILNRQRWFRRVQPDVALFVQSSNTPFRASIVGARLAGVPVVTTHRTLPWVKDFVPRGRHFFGLVPGLGLHDRRQILKTRLTAALADRIVYNSDAVRRAYEEVYHYPRRKGQVIVNAVQWPPPTGADRYPSGEVTIGYVGRLAAEKRIDLLLQATASLKTTRKIRLLIWGEGPEQRSLAKLADELGLAGRVAWCGPTDEVWSAYARMDIVVLCSRRESSSNMVLEAMAAGKAVVVTNVGGLPELIGHGRWGMGVPPEDTAALASALDRLVANEQERIALGRRAREAVWARHDARAVGRAWLNLLACAITQPPPPSVKTPEPFPPPSRTNRIRTPATVSGRAGRAI